MRCTFAMSYARARLWLGITGVGTMVVVSALLLLLGAPWRLLPTTTGTLDRDLTALAAVFFVYAALSAPFDFFGGWVLPTEFRKSSRSFGAFFAAWLRGVVFHGAFLLASATVLLIVARMWGFVGALGAFVGIQIALLLCQPLVARLLAGFGSALARGTSFSSKRTRRTSRAAWPGFPARRRSSSRRAGKRL